MPPLVMAIDPISNVGKVSFLEPFPTEKMGSW